MFNFIKKSRETRDSLENGERESESFKVKEEVIISTLDHRTNLVCGALDGKVFKVGEGPYPPFHTYCRCLRIPWVGFKSERPYVDPVEMVRPKKGKSPFYESVGKTPVNKRKLGTTTDDYNQWFDRQKNTETGRKFQRLLLGPSRYEAYISGELSLDDMVNFDTVKMYTLEELGLDPD